MRSTMGQLHAMTVDGREIQSSVGQPDQLLGLGRTRSPFATTPRLHCSDGRFEAPGEFDIANFGDELGQGDLHGGMKIHVSCMSCKHQLHVLRLT